MADKAGDAPSCLPPHSGDTSGVSAAGPPAPPPPDPPGPPNRPTLPGVASGRRLLIGVSHAGRVTSATELGINAPGEWVSAHEKYAEMRQRRERKVVEMFIHNDRGRTRHGSNTHAHVHKGDGIMRHLSQHINTTIKATAS